MTKKCTKKCAARAKLFFANYTYCCCWSVLLPFSVGSLSNYDDNHNDNFKKQCRFNDQNNSSARVFSTFLWRPLHDYDVKPLNLTTCGGRGHTTTNFPFSFWNWIKSLRIQLQEKSPAFGILSASKLTRLSLKESKFIFFLSTLCGPCWRSLNPSPFSTTRFYFCVSKF